MKDYKKPEIEFIDFSTEDVTTVGEISGEGTEDI